MKPRDSYLPQVLLATTVVAVLPSAIVWVVRENGLVTSYVAAACLGVALSLLGSQLGRMWWQRRPGSRNLLFSELMLWGYLHRRYTERKLDSAPALLGAMSGAQERIAGGLSRERQTKLLEQFARALDSRDRKTFGHSRRVARYAWMMATRMSMTREQVARVRTAAAIHDIGKIETPDEILNKPGSLSDDEYETMKLHAADGARMAEALHDEELTSFVRYHHERLDGTGYPDRLAGEAIPIGARIIAVADTFDALTANRPYRRARTHKEALEVLREEAGTRLDAGAVQAFCGYYSGRRGTTLWGWLSAVPQRGVEALSSAATSVGATAKVLAAAVVAGSLATSTATLAKPVSQDAGTSGAPAIAQAGASSSSHSSSADASNGTAAEGSGKGTGPGAPSSSRDLGAAAGGQTGASTGSPGEPSSGGSGAGSGGGSGSGGAGSGGEQHGGETRGSERQGGEAGGSERPATGSKPVSGPSAPSGSSGSGSSGGSGSGTVGGVVGKTKGAVEEVTGGVEKTKAKVEEVAKGTVEEVKGTVEQTKGKVEEVAKEKIAETKSTVEEVAKGKTEETVGKLKKIVGLARSAG